MANIFSRRDERSIEVILEKVSPTSPRPIEALGTAAFTWNLHVQTVAYRIFLMALKDLNPEQQNRVFEEAKKIKPYRYSDWQEELRQANR